MVRDWWFREREVKPGSLSHGFGYLTLKPTGKTRAGDLRYNIMVRLGNLGCPHDVDDLSTEDLRAHWSAHLAGGR